MITSHFAVAAPGDSGSGMLRMAIVEKFRNRPNPDLPIPEVINDTAHMRLEHIRKTHPGVTVITHIRNPFDYYLSRYFHLVRYGKYRGTFRDHLLADYAEYIAGRDPYHYRLTYTDYWNTFVDPEGIRDDRVIRFENFAEDTADILGRLCPDLGDSYFRGWFPEMYCQWRAIQVIEDIEQALRPQLYDAECRDYVERHDRALLDRFGYTFEGRTDV